MEANNENRAPETPDVPELEQGMQQDTSESNIAFNDIIGIPTPEPAETPQSEDTPQPVMDTEPAPEQNFSKNEVETKDNDSVRYEYWQSQAAKLQNQLNEVKEYQPMVDYLRANPEAVQSITPGGKPAEAAPTSQEQEEFPPPPAKPEQPRGFSREEAFSDPNSDSALYLDNVEKWRDDMQTYNQLAAQYEIATMRESYNEKLGKIEKIEQQRQEQSAAQAKMNEVRQYVSSNYDLGENVEDFITTMNDPSSLNMDDLVGYYKYKKGISAQAPAPTPVQPSNSFNQVKRAQSVPQPMGVQPAQGNTPESPSDSFMDALLKNNNKQNIL